MKSLFPLILLFSLNLHAANDLEQVARVQALVERREAVLNGPNCWNAALYSRGLVEGVRHVDGPEFTAWLSSPLCTEVPEDQATSGDVVALRRVTREGKLVKGPYGAEIHGYLLGSDGWGFTKNGTNRKDSYHFEESASIIRLYQTSNLKECRMLGIPKEACHLKAQYFRCDPAALSWDDSLTALVSKLSTLEQRLHAFYFDETRTSEERSAFKQAMSLEIRGLRNEFTLVGEKAPAWQLELIDGRLASAAVFLF
ncbi:MAG: hypothetical protein KF789_06615 [Bdellovibrionaceae bacterium]|nr:hypothetical protein [Pseudobdellovibrionaceae bacterium]